MTLHIKKWQYPYHNCTLQIFAWSSMNLISTLEILKTDYFHCIYCAKIICTVNTITRKTILLFKFRLLTSFFYNYKFTSNQKEAFLLTSMFNVYVYSCYLKVWFKSKLKSKVVFIVLIKSLSIVYKDGQKTSILAIFILVNG